MKRIKCLGLAAAAMFACQANNSELNGKIDEMNKKLDTLTEVVKKGGGARGPQRPQRPRPNPKDVYSVNINGSPFEGAKDAKVTVVEAYEFA